MDLAGGKNVSFLTIERNPHGAAEVNVINLFCGFMLEGVYLLMVRLHNKIL